MMAIFANSDGCTSKPPPIGIHECEPLIVVPTCGTNTAIIGLNSVKLDKYTVIASYTLFADGIYCDYDPVKKKADIGSNFLERE